MALKTQRDKILALLEIGYEIDGIMALRALGCFRLSARIYELKKEGHNIVMHYVTRDGKRWAVYHMVKVRA